MAQNAAAQSTLRIVPHPDSELVTFLTTEPKIDEKTGRVTRPAGTRMFRHLVRGTAEELAKYKIARGKYYLEDTDPKSPWYGTPIYNSQDLYETPRRLVFTRRGTVGIATDMETIRLEQSLRRAKQYGDGVLKHVEAAVATVIMADIQRVPVTVETVSQPQVNNLASLVQNGGLPDGQEQDQQDEGVVDLDNE